eukprot:330532-Rhodomonas_salina.2
MTMMMTTTTTKTKTTRTTIKADEEHEERVEQVAEEQLGKVQREEEAARKAGDEARAFEVEVRGQVSVQARTEDVKERM